MSEEDRSLIPLDRAPFTYKTATAIARTEFVPKGLRGNVPAILAAIMTGRELGLGPMESLRSIDVIDGRPSPSAEWMVGRVFEAGHIVVATEQTATSCTVRGTRFMGPDGTTYEMEFTFTIEMAKRAGLTNKSNWKNYPEAMLYWRAVAQLVRQFFPDVIRGIKHLPEELGSAEWLPPGYEQDMTVPTGTPTLEESQDDDLDLEEENVVHDAELIEASLADDWPPEPTGKEDELAIARVNLADGMDDLTMEVWAIVNNYEGWIDLKMESVEREVRFIHRGMERLGHWQGGNTLRESLRQAGHVHLSELKKDDLASFARNTVTKAMAVISREEGI